MNKNWKEYSPKDNSWEKIMQKQDFESQLAQNLKKLPEHSPSDFAWGAIEEKLEKKKRLIVFRPFLIAASLTGLFLLAFYLIRQGAAVLETPNVPQEILANTPALEEVKTPTPGEAEKVILEQETPTKQVNPEQKIQRKSIQPIQVSASQLAFEQDFQPKPLDLQKRNPYMAALVTPKESYHRVAISWGLKQKTQLKLGAQSEELIGQTEILTAQENTKPTKNPLKFIIK